MIDTLADTLNLVALADAVEDLGAAVTSEIGEWMDNRSDTRSDGGVAVDFLLNPANAHLVVPVLAAVGWQPPAWATTPGV